jgi:hypothetical protein
MYIYKIINKQNGRWYIGKTNGQDPNYMGSGKLLKQAYAKYGKQNFEKIILEICSSLVELNQREQHWITESGALSDPLSYNLAEGGSGGDLSKFIDYKKRVVPSTATQQAHKWFHNLTKEQQKEFHARQAAKRTKGWYVSRVDDPTEIYVDNISKWCEEHGVDKSMPSSITNPKSRLYGKQSKGWRFRRSDMSELPTYENLRGKIIIPNGCKGKSWKIEDGKRIWYDK